MTRAQRALTAAVCLAAFAVMGSSSARYLPPVKARGMVFPVARSDWYSVINFTNDWHAPRMRLIDGRWRQVGIHEGTDIFAEPGTPVRAVASGRVERIGWTFYSGWRVGIRDERERYWFYAHLRRFAEGLGVGTPVKAGDKLGEVGNSGYGSDPGHADEFPHHLHLGIQAGNGAWQNPYPLLQRLYQAAVAEKR